MCGLVGMVGFLDHKHKQTMKELLFLDSLRGMDSTGLTAVKRDRTVATRKMTVPGYEFIQSPVVEKAMTFGDQLWIGHNRFKTTGEISKANAHPFEVLDDEGDILLAGAHNGTLNNKYELEKELGEKFDTDSEALFNLLVDQPTFKAAINKLKGAWSLVWWDPTQDSVHFCRNAERPMTYAFTKDRKVMIWASEPWMLVNACRRNGVELDLNDKGLACYSTIADNLYTMRIPQERDVVLPELVKEGGYSGAPSANFHQNGYGRFKSWWDAEGGDEQEKFKKAAEKGAEKATSIAKETSNVIDIGFARGFNGEQLTLIKLHEIKRKGCAWNGCTLERETPFAFLNEERMVCLKCLHDMHDKAPDDDDLDDDLPFNLDVDPLMPEQRQLVNAALGSAKA
jgi:predicted glutamine amidotransferase